MSKLVDHDKEEPRERMLSPEKMVGSKETDLTRERRF
jgi:hypothetical protein